MVDVRKNLMRRPRETLVGYIARKYLNLSLSEEVAELILARAESRGVIEEVDSPSLEQQYKYIL
jgi:hypothetical protein